MLINFLTDVISNMDVFRDDITTCYLYHDGGKLVATGNHPKRLLFYKVEPIADLTHVLEAPAYLGALSYLRALLGSALMKETPRIEVVYREHDGKKHCVQSLKFLAKRFESYFECTNPAILVEKDRLRQFSRPNEAVFFSLNKEIRKDFDDVARFNTPKADVRLFTLSYEAGIVRAIFGTGTHTSTLVLTDTVTGHTDQKFTKQISLDRFRAMFKLASENQDGRVGFHPNALWVDFQTLQSTHTVVTPTIREQAR